jgi:putative addiction module CopG family antidote
MHSLTGSTWAGMLLRHRLTRGYPIFTLKVMEVQLTPGQKSFVRHAIETGRFRREEDVVEEALSLWEKRERARVELLVALDESEDDLEAGHFNDYTNETLPQLADELKREARALRDSKQPS